ncbi:hypothetical protein IE53DRAFT_388401 [Violaceomyces palustris]|uniref:Uncharacterized protein n=1 Tax=Violaceomyces palustris TaxID=1673888 RepID=A0ACD0NUA7_9BASI|nr:hypothetical protein IE53DRAFT_388401 [Violaceomyces palustris]
MSANLDKPLDEIIAARPKKAGRGRGRGGKRGSGRTGGSAKAAALGSATQNAAVIAASNRNRPPIVIPGRAPGGKDPGSKIILSNLPLDVNEAQVKELFATTIGPLRKIVMSYRANGTSTGVCTVEFQRGDDASRAYQQYNNRLIDGKRPLKVEVVVDPARAAIQVAPIAAPAAPARQANANASTSRGRGAARGRGRGGRGARQSRPKKTIEDLDAEMEDYNNQNAGDAAAAPAPAA